MTTNFEDLKSKAKEIRCLILKMLCEAGSGHTGGALSLVEILLALYYCKMRYDVNNPDWEGRDRFVLSKGHGCPALYAVLADAGYFPKEELMTLRKLGSRLQGHPDKVRLPALDTSTGSLGQGLSMANGMALAAKLDAKDLRVYCVMGDGECNEGQVWEAAMTASHYKLDNVCGIIDRNSQQIDGWTHEVKKMNPIHKKWEAFGWFVIEVNGHSVEEIVEALNKAETIKERPTLIIARTVKGKGVSFMENEICWHGIAPKKEELEKALGELCGE